MTASRPTHAGRANGGGAAEAWFLSADERGNPATDLDRRHADGLAWTRGNHVEAMIHGGPYFERLVRLLSATKEGDSVHILDWRGDADQILVPGVELAALLAELAERGVRIRGLVWRSHPEVTGFHLHHHLELAQRIDRAGGLLLLDERVRRAGSHHQKLVVIRHGDAREDVAFVGGVDLCHGRRDDIEHHGDPQPEEMDDRYGPTPPWHDVQLFVRGPAVDDLAYCFRERWEDPTPLDEGNAIRTRLARIKPRPERRDALPTPAPMSSGEGEGDLAIQVIRTYPAKRPPFPFAPAGERSVVRAYRKAFARARRLIYVEDQYLWSAEVGRLFVEALEREPELRAIAVVPRVPDRNGVFSGPALRVGQLAVLERLSAVGADRIAVYDRENETGTPIYVHAKVVIVDDVWATVGSDNLNRRSWTHDSELSCAILDPRLDEREPRDPAGMGDGARRFPRDLRLSLMREHTQLDDDEPFLDPTRAFETFAATAAAIEAWARGGRRGPRPPGRLRPHRADAVRWWQRPWAWPAHRMLVDPDGRPRALRRAGSY